MSAMKPVLKKHFFILLYYIDGGKVSVFSQFGLGRDDIVCLARGQEVETATLAAGRVLANHSTVRWD